MDVIYLKNNVKSWPYLTLYILKMQILLPKTPLLMVDLTKDKLDLGGEGINNAYDWARDLITA